MRYTLGDRLSYLEYMKELGAIEKAEGGCCFTSIKDAWEFLLKYKNGENLKHWTIFGLDTDCNDLYLSKSAIIYCLDDIDYSIPIDIQIDKIINLDK